MVVGGNMTIDEFKELCKSYLPECHFKDNGTCGICCYNHGDDVYSIVVALLPDGRYAVYDQWRDITITRDLDYMKNWLEHKRG